MKIRNGFVSNSSSTSFMITNKSDKTLTLEDFVKENLYLIDRYVGTYGLPWACLTEKQRTSTKHYNKKETLECKKRLAKQVLASVTGYSYTFSPGETLQCVFGDETGDALGTVYDYALREGGSSENFSWEFHEYWR